MTDLTSGPADATPLTEDERKGLMLPVLTRDELNRAEAENISLAMSWLFFSQRRLRTASTYPHFRRLTQIGTSGH